MRAYSVDLRKAALKLKEQGKSYKEVTELLGVSRSTVYLWSKRDSLEPYKRPGRPEKKLEVTDWSSFVKKHQGMTLKQMAEFLPIGKSSLQRRLRKAGLTYKKKSTTYIEACPEKQKKFQEDLKRLDPSKIYYLDESGFDERHLTSKGWSFKGQRLSGKKKEKEDPDTQ
jgi:transposase